MVRVLANPYSFIDADGEPQGVYPDEPDVAGGGRRFVAADFDYERTKLLEEFKSNDPRRLAHVAPRQTTKFAFATEPVPRPKSKHYRDGIRTGCLIACDADSAAFAGVDFLAPDKALARERNRAAAQWRANYGTPAPFETEKKLKKAE